LNFIMFVLIFIRFVLIFIVFLTTYDFIILPNVSIYFSKKVGIRIKNEFTGFRI
jgi:chemotaxis methyl-accepting protein methylase